MFARFFTSLIFLPLGAWFLMVTVGAFQPMWSILPLLGYSQAVVIVFVSLLFNSWYSDEMPFVGRILLTLITALPTMLTLGFLHGGWDWIPALGYWQVVLLGIPGMLVLGIIAVGTTLLGALGVLVGSLVRR